MVRKILHLLTIKEKIILFFAILCGSSSQVLIAYSFSKLTSIFTPDKNIDIFNLLKIILLILIALSFSGFNYIYIGWIREDICSEIRKKSFENIMYSKASYISKMPKGYFYNEVLAKVDMWKFRYLDCCINIVTSALSLLWVILLISSIDFRINIFLILFMLPLILNNIIFPKKMEKTTFKSMDENANLLESMREYLESILIIKNNNSYKKSMEPLIQAIENTNTAAKNDQFLSNLSAYFANTGVTISQVSSIIISFIYFIKGYIDFGIFITFIQLSMYIQEPVISIINSFVGISTVKKINKNLEKVLTLDVSEYESNLSKINNITIENLNYKYNKKDKVFNKNINLVFEKNKKYLIVGESGSGKSTLVKILMKYNEGYEGSVKFNNIELRDLEDKDIESHILYVPQNLFIFNKTIRENIDPQGHHSDKEILEAMEKVNLTYLIDDSGLDRIISQDINSISGGEASRLYMAKILLSDKNVIILDEILCGLDYENSKKIENLIVNMENKMILHIAHNSNHIYENKYDEKIVMK